MGRANSYQDLLRYKLRHVGVWNTLRVAYLDLSEEFLYRLSTRFPSLAVSPRSIQIECTTRCNLKAGVTVVIMRDDMIERTPANLPVMLDYKTLSASGSLHNTPPAFAIYIVGLVFQWAKKLGGLAEVQKTNQKKAGLVYEAIDQSGGFYRGHAAPEARSVMNIPFRLPSEELEDQFAKEAKKNELIGLKGHRSVGGMRASVYNAMTVEGAEALVQFMKEFQKKNG